MDSSGPVPIIHNPAAGGGRGTARFHEAQKILRGHGIQADPVATEYPRHATELAEELAREGYGHILVLGGDGTLSEAANGILKLPKAKRPICGFIPAGTGNDILRDFGVLTRDEAIKRIAKGVQRPMDAFRVRYDDDSGRKEAWSINLVGTGFAPQSVAITNRRYKWARSQAYNLGIVHNLLALKPQPTRVTIDGKEQSGDYPMTMVCNTIHTGSAMQMAPMARIDDGLADVMTVSHVTRMELLSLLGKVRSGGHVSHPAVQFQTAKRIDIEPATPGALLVDGEVFGSTPVRIDVMPAALQVMA